MNCTGGLTKPIQSIPTFKTFTQKLCALTFQHKSCKLQLPIYVLTVCDKVQLSVFRRGVGDVEILESLF